MNESMNEQSKAQNYADRAQELYDYFCVLIDKQRKSVLNITEHKIRKIFLSKSSLRKIQSTTIISAAGQFTVVGALRRAYPDVEFCESKSMNETIETVRKANNLTCAEMGEKIGVSGRTVQNWKQGRKVPKFAMLIIDCLIAKGELK